MFSKINLTHLFSMFPYGTHWEFPENFGFFNVLKENQKGRSTSNGSINFIISHLVKFAVNC